MEIPHTSISASTIAGTATRYSNCFLRALNVKDISNDVLAFDGRSNTAINTQLRFLLHAQNFKCCGSNLLLHGLRSKLTIACPSCGLLLLFGESFKLPVAGVIPDPISSEPTTPEGEAAAN